MPVITLFGPPEPEDKNVVGTADVINYFPKLNLQGKLLWEQRPGLTAIALSGLPYQCSPQSYPWEDVFPDTPQWEIGNFILTVADALIDSQGETEPGVVEMTLSAPLTSQTIGLTYKNEARSRLRLLVYNENGGLVAETTLPTSLTPTTTVIENLASVYRIQIVREAVF